MTHHITPELIRAALAHIPANLARDEWARIGMAIKSEFPDEAGFALFDEWSATADGYTAKATRTTWRSIKAGGGVTVGTLLHEAKARGFEVHAPAQPHTGPSDTRQTRQRVERAQADEARRRAAQAAAAQEAAQLWQAARETGGSPHPADPATGLRLQPALPACQRALPHRAAPAPHPGRYSHCLPRGGGRAAPGVRQRCKVPCTSP